MSAGDLSALEQLFSLSGLDVSALLGASSGAHAGGGAQQLVHDQAALSWGAPEQQSLLREVAHSLAQLEEQRQRQQQVANAIQTLQALQQQENDLALLQQQLSAVPRANAFQRSRTCDLDHHTMPPGPGQVSALAAVQHQQSYGQVHQPAPLDYEQQLLALQAAHPGLSLPTTGPLGNARVARNLMNAPPQRSYSSEALRIGSRAQQAAAGSTSAAQSAAAGGSNNRGSARHQQQQQGQGGSGLPANGRSQGRAADGGRRSRYAATAKAPSWASSDWHPMKAVLANKAPAAASTGTGVFLPHLADVPKQGSASAAAAAPEQPAAAVSATLAQPGSPGHEGSPSCSVDGVSLSDPFSRTSTLDFSRTSTFTDSNDAHGTMLATQPVCGLDALAEGEEAEADGCDFSALARELAELMGRQGSTSECQ